MCNAQCIALRWHSALRLRQNIHYAFKRFRLEKTDKFPGASVAKVSSRDYHVQRARNLNHRRSIRITNRRLGTRFPPPNRGEGQPRSAVETS